MPPAGSCCRSRRPHRGDTSPQIDGRPRRWHPRPRWAHRERPTAEPRWNIHSIPPTTFVISETEMLLHTEQGEVSMRSPRPEKRKRPFLHRKAQPRLEHG